LTVHIDIGYCHFYYFLLYKLRFDSLILNEDDDDDGCSRPMVVNPDVLDSFSFRINKPMYPYVHVHFAVEQFVKL